MQIANSLEEEEEEEEEVKRCNSLFFLLSVNNTHLLIEFYPFDYF
jgi:hypothetical protein